MVRRAERRALAAALTLGCLVCCGCRDRSGEDFPPEPSVPPRSAGMPAGPAPVRPAQRYCWVIGLNPVNVEEFQNLHKKIPLPVKEAIHQAGFRNYTVFECLTETQFYAIRFYEYVGEEHEGDMAALDRNPAYKTWRNQCEACEVPLDVPPKLGKWWSESKEVLHLD